MSRVNCHVCGREKKPYTVFMNNDDLSFITYTIAREPGEICQRCDQYFAMTGEFRDASEEEFENAEKASWFAHRVLEWWEKDMKLVADSEVNALNFRDFPGTHELSKWCRDKLNGVKQ